MDVDLVGNTCGLIWVDALVVEDAVYAFVRPIEAIPAEEGLCVAEVNVVDERCHESLVHRDGLIVGDARLGGGGSAQAGSVWAKRDRRSKMGKRSGLISYMCAPMNRCDKEPDALSHMRQQFASKSFSNFSLRGLHVIGDVPRASNGPENGRYDLSRTQRTATATD